MATDREIEDFLLFHEPFVKPPLYAEGDMFGEWRIVSFLGRGGSAEVYRAVHAKLETPVAIKALAKLTDAARARFAEEARLLAVSLGDSFPRFHAYAERDGRPYIVEECLDPYELPGTDRAVADFLLRLCAGVGVLHRNGLVHRDLKPQNVMRRVSDGSPVLIDLGLVKDEGAGSSAGEESVSIVEGRSVAVGTPGFSAPEQFTGGAVSPATDVHALGAIANACFSGRPPFCWRPIIRRATSSIPEQRYATVDALARAIRRRNANAAVFGAVASALALIVCAILFVFANRPEETERNSVVAGEEGTNTQVEAVRANQRDFMRRMQEAMLGIEPEGYKREAVGCRWEDVADRTLTNGVQVVKVWLNDRIVKITDKVSITQPTQLYVVGPGTLDVDISGTSGVSVKILNKAVLLNRTKMPYPESGIKYSICNESYLNFVNLKMPKEKTLKNISVDSELIMFDWGGPETYREAQIKRFNLMKERDCSEERCRQQSRRLERFGIRDESKGF